MLLSNDKDKSIARILISGIVILAVCLVACMLHLADIKSAFEKETKSNFSYQVADIEQVLSTELEKIMKTAVNAADQISDPVLVPSDEEIFEVLDHYKDNFEDIRFVNLRGEMYLSDQTKVDVSEEYDLMKLRNYPNETISIQEYEKEGEKSLYVLFQVPVEVNVTIQGHIMAYIDIKHMLNGKSYEYLTKTGYGLITDHFGRIVTETKNIEKMVSKKKGLYDVLMEQVQQTEENRLRIRNFQENIKKRSQNTMKLMSKKGETLFISYQRIKGTDGIYFVSCYNENLAMDKIQPVIFRSALTSMLIIILMIIAILYVWASSKRANVTIEKIAFEDEITKGKNLNYFKDRAVEIMRSNKEMPFLIQRYDIANFRYINEAYGHIRADEILKGCIQVAEEFSIEKELCVRMYADQFLMLSQNDGRVDQRREDYIRGLNDFARSVGIKYPIRLKFGIYQVRKNDIEIDVMIERANVARKSLTGEEKVLQAYYSDSIIKEMRKIDKIESEMQKALDTGEFKVYMQPKWDIENNKLYGAEALARWIKPDRSMIMPLDFISVFEKNGFIEKLDFYMLESVCKSMKELIDLGVKVVPVSVNQSRILLNSPDYTRNIARILERYNIPKEFIELELTETVFMEEQETMIKIMKELKDLKIRISMDDFGSGYSSLNILKDIPFDVLKIDREFFSESFMVENSRWILQKIVEMVHGLGVAVVFEGVENAEQIEFLKEIGCRYVQGYYFAAPMPIASFNRKYYGVDYELSD